jgi:hypothetical protein
MFKALDDLDSNPRLMEHISELNLLHLQTVLSLPEPKTPGNSLKPSEFLSF